MILELISCTSTPVPTEDPYKWLNDATAGREGGGSGGIAQMIAEGIMDGFSAVGEWIWNGLTGAVVWIVEKLAPIVTYISEAGILLCLFVFLMTNDKKYSSSLLKWIIVFFISLVLQGGVF